MVEPLNACDPECIIGNPRFARDNMNVSAECTYPPNDYCWAVRIEACAVPHDPISTNYRNLILRARRFKHLVSCNEVAGANRDIPPKRHYRPMLWHDAEPFHPRRLERHVR